MNFGDCGSKEEACGSGLDCVIDVEIRVPWGFIYVFIQQLGAELSFIISPHLRALAVYPSRKFKWKC